MKIVRWVLVLPVVLAAFYVCVAAALGIYMTAEAFCPPELVVSEVCIAGYMSTTKESLLLLTPPIAACFMVLCASLIAPSHKEHLAIATFVLGTIAALYYAFDSSYWATFALTEISAAAVTYWLFRKHRKRNALT